MQNKIKIILINILIIISCTHCASYDFSNREIQQGNLLSHSKIERIKIGMTKDEVAIVMGSSLLSPVYDLNHWDYAYSFRRGSGANKIKHFVIYFKNDRVVSFEHV